MCEKCKSPDPGAEFIVQLLTAGIVIEVVNQDAPDAIPDDVDIHHMFWCGRLHGLLTRGQALVRLAEFLRMPVIEVAMAIDRHNALIQRDRVPFATGWEATEG